MEKDDESRQDPLAWHRQVIDRIDATVLALLSERLAVAEAIGTIKTTLGVPLHDPAREDDVLRRIAEAPCRLSPEARRVIFRAVIDESLALEEAPSATGAPSVVARE